MKNKNFFYLQYNKINWENQEKTKINYSIYNFIIQNIILKKESENIKIFDIGFGVGLFIKKLCQSLTRPYKNIIIEGCEPSRKNYKNFLRKKIRSKRKVKLKTYNKTFLDVKTDTKFDFIAAIYVFPHFLLNEMERVAKKIYSMLDVGNKFVLVVADEEYLEEKLKTQKDLFIEKNIINFKGKKYKELLHYSDIPKIGKIIDYNREDTFYIDLFKKNNFDLEQKEKFNDKGFICNVFVFKKKIK